MEQISICPECGNQLIHQEGCLICPSCGWSECGFGQTELSAYDDKFKIRFYTFTVSTNSAYCPCFFLEKISNHNKYKKRSFSSHLLPPVFSIFVGCSKAARRKPIIVKNENIREIFKADKSKRLAPKSEGHSTQHRCSGTPENTLLSSLTLV